MVSRPHLVTLSARANTVTDDADGPYDDLDPPTEWVAIQPLAPSAEGRVQESYVTLRYRADVTIDTRILFGTRRLFVRGIQHVDERRIEMRLFAQEAI
jgi:head-tail adaptor